MTTPREPDAGENQERAESAESVEFGERPRKRRLGLPPEERVKLGPGQPLADMVSECRDDSHD